MRHRLTSALMSGEPAEGLAPRYLVMSLAMEESTAVATRRRVHRLPRELDAFGEGPALPLLDGSGGSVLVAWSGPWARVEELVVRLARLRKVAALTGLDSADDADVQRVGAALAARRVRG